ncbi:ankyrin repeat-containing domain protein [Aspergillus karnatakaensis]|uniref:ankyrin repeat domain-containing protein n=1 Tax=Aspergillus karnatakaensis TaxID=1810916 RepID=UPI003CCE4FF2
MLITAGADITARDDPGDTPFHAAASRDNGVIVERLLTHYRDMRIDPLVRDFFDQTVLEHSAKAGSVQVLETIPRKNIDITAPNLPEHGNHRGTSALHLAVQQHHHAPVKFLISCETDPLYLDLYGQTPMDWAAQQGSDDILRALQNCGCTYTPADPRTRSTILRHSISALAGCVLSGGQHEIDRLGKCLQFIGDIQAAWTVLAQSSPAYCDLCNHDFQSHDKRFVCTICPSMELCRRCMEAYNTSADKFVLCSGHGFVSFIAEDYMPKEQRDGAT